MSGCALRRWGPGTCSGAAVPQTAVSTELAAKLATMRAERDRQDGMWLAPSEPLKKEQEEKPVQKSKNLANR